MTGREIWILAEHRDGELREITLEMLREGKKLADKVQGKLCAVLLGDHVKFMADTLAKYGAERVYLAEHPHLDQYSIDGYTAVLYELTRSHEPMALLIGDTPYGRDLAPYLASRLKVGLLAGCVMLKINEDGHLEGTRPAYGGKVYSTERCLSKTTLATVRPGVIGVDKQKNSRQVEVIDIQPVLDSVKIRTRVTGFLKADPASVDLAEAEIIVAGGRGVGCQEQWRLIEELAELMEGSVGGSRVAQDAGWIFRERMIGQTGRTISPRCYLAAGISGASAHINGIKESKLIIAINKDRTAPIFKLADMAITGDMHQILPAIIRKLREQTAGTDSHPTEGGKKQ